MPTIDDLLAADQNHTEAIAALREDMDVTKAEIQTHRERLGRIDQAMETLKGLMDKTATKDDIEDFKNQVVDVHHQQLAKAQDSVPFKAVVVFILGVVVLGVFMALLAHLGL